MLKLLAKNIKQIIFWGLGLAVVFLVVSFLIPKSYRAEGQILIIVREKNAADPVAQARSAEQAGKNLSLIILTQDFTDKVLASGFNFDRIRWSNLDEISLRKEWKRDVRGSMINGASLFKISAYGKSQDDAKNFTGAVMQTLVNHGWEYTGADLTLKIVDSPVVLGWGARPSVIYSTLAGFALGLVLSALWAIFYKKRVILPS